MNEIVSDIFALTHLDKKIKAKLRRKKIKRILGKLTGYEWVALFIVIIASLLLILRVLGLI